MYGDLSTFVVAPEIDDDGNIVGEASRMELDVEGFRQVLAEVCKKRAENPFRVMLRYFGGGRGKSNICPISVIDPDISKVIMMADRCETYHALPNGNAVEDQPNWLMEAFDVFRATKNEYEREALEEMKGK